MRRKKNIWVDGSLRDGEWYRSVFAGIRTSHSHYQIAIIQISATEGAIWERVRKRAEQTGRHVPESEVLDSLRRVPETVELLAPYSAFVATIDNTEETPKLVEWRWREKQSAQHGAQAQADADANGKGEAAPPAASRRPLRISMVNADGVIQQDPSQLRAERSETLGGKVGLAMEDFGWVQYTSSPTYMCPHAHLHMCAREHGSHSRMRAHAQRVADTCIAIMSSDAAFVSPC